MKCKKCKEFKTDDPANQLSVRGWCFWCEDDAPMTDEEIAKLWFTHEEIELMQNQEVYNGHTTD